MTVVRPIERDDVPALERHMLRRMPGTHRKRLESQHQGEGTYFIAWVDHVPAGHLLIQWQGAAEEPARSALPRCPFLVDIAVHPTRQSRGIGSQLMAAAERLATERGYERVGLSVAVDNVRARSLYERRRYVDAGIGERVIGWPYLDDAGLEGWEEETVVYLVKDLR